jgi:hypothetical protein
VSSRQGGADPAGGADAREGELMKEQKWIVAMENISGWSRPPANPFAGSSYGFTFGRPGRRGRHGVGRGSGARRIAREMRGMACCPAHAGKWGTARHSSSQRGSHGEAWGASTCLAFMLGITAQSVANQRLRLAGTCTGSDQCPPPCEPTRTYGQLYGRASTFPGPNHTDNHR